MIKRSAILIGLFQVASLLGQDVATPLKQAQSSINTALQADALKTATVANLTSQVSTLTAKVADLTAQLAAQTTPDGTGKVKYLQMTDPSWDQYLNSADATLQATIRGEVQRLATFTPFFDQKLTWLPNALVYFDSYAVYNPSTLASQHPEWILKDTSGNKLFIPWGCSNGTCPQYAGDIANPAYRAFQVAQLGTAMAAGGATPNGYVGVWFDDVNMALAVGNGSGAWVAPVDSNTGQAMTAAAWRQYFATYLQQVKAAYPNKEILHNSVWYTMRDLPGDPSIAAQIAASTYINIERGFGDGGITGGTGVWSLSSLMAYVDSVHAMNRPVVVEDLSMADQAYSLACYFLVQNGKDYFGIQAQNPGNWPPKLYKVDLGTAKGGRYKSSNLWRRDFANGIALVNEPGAASSTIQLPSTMYDENGAAFISVTLGAKQGKVLRTSPW